MKRPSPAVKGQEWHDLRDAQGKLYARLEPRLWLLEVRRNQQTVIFDLKNGRVRMKEVLPPAIPIQVEEK